MSIYTFDLYILVTNTFFIKISLNYRFFFIIFATNFVKLNEENEGKGFRNAYDVFTRACGGIKPG